MSDDVEHFYFESCTCYLMSNIAFSVIKISRCTHYANRSTTVQIGFWFSDDPVQRSRWSVSIDTHVRDHMAPRCSTSGGSCRWTANVLVNRGSQGRRLMKHGACGPS